MDVCCGWKVLVKRLMHSECRSQRRSRECVLGRRKKEGSKHQAKYVSERVRGWKVDLLWLLQERARLLGDEAGKEGATGEGWAGALAAARPSNTRE